MYLIKQASASIVSYFRSSSWNIIQHVGQVARYHKLILERLDNEPLLAAFGIDAGFNMQDGVLCACVNNTLSSDMLTGAQDASFSTLPHLHATMNEMQEMDRRHTL